MKLNNHGGGLHLLDIRPAYRVKARILTAPPGWDCPERLDNSAYCTPLECQGVNPWCAAYSMGQLLSASFWREHHRKVDFPEHAIYASAKTRDGIKGDGTTLEAVIQATPGIDYGLKLAPSLASERVYATDDVLFAVHKVGLVLVGLQISKGWNRLNADGSIGNAAGTLGGHAVLVSGYDLPSKTIWGPNWWGRAWGQKGWWKMTLDQFTEQFGYGYAIRITWGAK